MARGGGGDRNVRRVAGDLNGVREGGPGDGTDGGADGGTGGGADGGTGGTCCISCKSSSTKALIFSFSRAPFPALVTFRYLINDACNATARSYSLRCESLTML